MPRRNRRGVSVPLLKRCLPRNEMNWGAEPMILARSSRDQKVMQSFLALGVRGQPREVQSFLRAMFDQATGLVTRRQMPAGMTLPDFCRVFGWTNPLAMTINDEAVFSELFEALIFGRARYIQRGEETGWAEMGSARPGCPLALAIDAFVLAAPFVDWESDRVLVAADVDDDVVEIRLDENDQAVVTVATAGGSGAAGLLSLAESMNAMGVVGVEEEEEAYDDNDEAIEIFI